MSTFVLVHGAWHGAWAWDLVTPLLEKAGHSVVARDLPGLGEDHTPASAVTLSAYAESIASVLQQQSEPAFLVGHSMGGLSITQAAELASDKIAGLVYVCAYLPADGESVQVWAERYSGRVGAEDLVFSDDGQSMTLKDDVVVDALYHDVPSELAAWAKSKLRPQAVAPWGTRVSTTAERFGSVPRHYVECVNDRVMPPEMQRAMRTALPCESVQSLESGHSPFAAAPADLAAALLRIAEQYADR